MFKIDEMGTIKLTRGDTTNIIIQTPGYEIQREDIINMTVRKNDHPTAGIVFRKTIKGANVITINSEDTQKVAWGNYIYDIELKTAAGDRRTFGPCRFAILREVTY